MYNTVTALLVIATIVSLVASHRTSRNWKIYFQTCTITEKEEKEKVKVVLLKRRALYLFFLNHTVTTTTTTTTALSSLDTHQTTTPEC